MLIKPDLADEEIIICLRDAWRPDTVVWIFANQFSAEWHNRESLSVRQGIDSLL